MIRAMICSVVFLVLGTGCTTIKCSGEKTGEEEITVTVTDTGQSFASLLGEIVKLNGTSLTDLIRQGAANGDFSDEEKAQIKKTANEAARDYVKNNPEKFCNKCTNGEPCAAEAATMSLDEKSITVKRVGNGWEVVVVYLLNFTIRCGACPDCDRTASSQSGATTGAVVFAQGDPATCEGTSTDEYFEGLIDYSTPVDASEGPSASIPDAVTE